MQGNCGTYAVGKYFADGCTGRIRPRIVWAGGLPKLRFYYVDPEGNGTYFYPLRPRRGVAACLHSLWFEGQVRKA